MSVIALSSGAVFVAGRDDSVAPAPAPAAARADTWVDVVTGLDRARVAAWSTVDVRALLTADAPGSSAVRDDRAVIGRLRIAGLRPVGVRFDVRSVGVVSTTGYRVRLHVVDRRSAYALVDRSGVEAERVDARAEQVWQVDLVRVAGAWRFDTEHAVGS